MTCGAVRGELEVVEAAVRSGATAEAALLDRRGGERREPVLVEAQERVEERLEVRSADQCGAVPLVVQQAATEGVSTGSGTPFIHTPWVWGCWPVSIVEHEGTHTTDCGTARS